LDKRDKDRVAQVSARAGYAARGVIFTIIGSLAFLAAKDSRSPAVGTRGALELLLAQPFGWALLWFVSAGLLCFAVWRIIQASFDTDGCGSDAKGILRRIAMLGGAVVNFSLSVLAASIAIGAPAIADDNRTARDWTAWLFSQPFGRSMVMLVGLSIVMTGIGLFWKAIQAEFRQQIAADADNRVWIAALGQFGYVTRGIVFAMMGAFLVIAAWKFNSGEAAGMSGALRALRHQPYGPYLLGLAGAGLCSYGLFEFVQSFLRRIRVDR